MPEVILHHYPMSPFAEKIRLMFGIKGTAWKSVGQPMIMPKPDLTALTGGYRRIPVLQIGADIYCDTLLIAQVLDDVLAGPRVLPDASLGRQQALGAWVEQVLFWPVARYKIGRQPEKFPLDFHADRAAMWGRQPDLARMQGAAPSYRRTLLTLLPWMEQMVQTETPFLFGREPGYADTALYHPLWFLLHNDADLSALLEPFPDLRAWMKRVAAIGHGRPETLSPADALTIAADSAPRVPDETVVAAPDGLALGDPAVVTPEQFGLEAVEGTLVALTASRMTLLRRTDRLGDVAVHFPRFGYVLKRGA